MRRIALNGWLKWSIIFCLISWVCPVFIHASGTINLKTADAIYERIDKTYQVHRDGSSVLTLHFRVKILTYKGKKDHADFRYPFNTSYQTVQVESAKTVTADGRIFPVDRKEIHDINDPEDAGASIYSREHMKVVNFPSVEPGTTVELKLKVTSRRGFWATECFRLGDPVMLKIVTVSLPKGMSLKVKQPVLKVKQKITHEGGRTIYRWTARHIPKQIEEPLLPPVEDRGTCLFLSTFTSWHEIAAYFRKMLPKDVVKGVGKEFQVKSPDQLYVRLMKRFLVYPLDLFHTSLRFQAPGVTLKKGYGCQEDLAILFYALLKLKGYHPEFLMMNSEDVSLGEFEGMPAPSLFDDILVRCRGIDYAFYAKELPPGFNGLQGALVLDLGRGRLVPARQRYANRSMSRMTLFLTPTAGLKGHFALRAEGRQAILLRSWLRYKTAKEWRIAASRIYHQIDPIAQIEGKLTCQGLNTLSAPVLLKGRFLLHRPFPASGPWSFITVRKPDLPGGLAPLLKGRQGALMIPKNYEESLTMNLSLPLHVQVYRSPHPERGSIKAMDWDYRVTSMGDHLTVRRVIRLKRSILFPGTRAYWELRQVVKKLYSPADRLIVLERIPRR